MPTYDMLTEYRRRRSVLHRRARCFHRRVQQLRPRRTESVTRNDSYEALSGEVGGNWDWKHRGPQGGGFFPGSANVSGDLIQALMTNPHLQVQVENGFYDMATPFFATEYTMDHLFLPGNSARQHPLRILRRRPHDVPARRRPNQTEVQHRRPNRLLPQNNPPGAPISELPRFCRCRLDSACSAVLAVFSAFESVLTSLLHFSGLRCHLWQSAFTVSLCTRQLNPRSSPSPAAPPAPPPSHNVHTNTNTAHTDP